MICPSGHIFTFRKVPENTPTPPSKTLNTCLVVSDVSEALKLYQSVLRNMLGDVEHLE